MGDPRWLRVITVGLVLAALAVGYFLISGKFSKSTSPSVLSQDVSPTPFVSPKSAYDRIVDRNLSNVNTLPKTAFPTSLLMVFSAGTIIAGMGLRKFPH